MAILDLHLLGSPVLRQHSSEVTEVDAELRQFIADLFETMDAAKGVGLAANQVGVARRVAVVGIEQERLALVNPVILSAEGRARQEEGCLSIPEVYGEVERPERIVLEALGPDGKPYRREANGLLARAIQHEIDHLDGILFFDHLSVLKRQRLLARYKKEHRGEGIIKSLRPEPVRQR
ncbi:MAG TPA: peptide deformylase [Gemmatimonadales bacterium]|jgi:peptide deformylase|nr:peptide deformylase [Gemmatimonadales bacterium]